MAVFSLNTQELAAELSNLAFKEEQRGELLAALRKAVRRAQAKIRATHRDGAGGFEVVRALSVSADAVLGALWQLASAVIDLRDCAVIAVGGYGRGELNPRSDIDIMFCHGKSGGESCAQVAQILVSLLWDLGLEAGSSVRSLDECFELGMRDVTVRTALLDSRFVAGDAEFFEAFVRDVAAPLRRRDVECFIAAKLEERAARWRKYGSSVHLLEPNVKEGKGGLRDLHTALWILKARHDAADFSGLLVKGALSAAESTAFRSACDWLWRVRNELHYAQRRKSDRLSLGMQEQVARFFSYHDYGNRLAVEHFMRDYYRHAENVEELAASLISRATSKPYDNALEMPFVPRSPLAPDRCFALVRNEIVALSDDAERGDNPLWTLRAFWHAQRQHAPLAQSLRETVRAHAARQGALARADREACALFMDILGGERVADTLREMRRLRFLNAFLPELGAVFCMVQHDAYHIYTVDTHALFAVEELERLWRGDNPAAGALLKQAASGVERRELLLLAALLQDVGKGAGSNHALRGAKMMPAIAKRLGLDENAARQLEFLVAHHLLMAQTALRRDLNDAQTLDDFAKAVGNRSNLRMLFLLTFADLRAVGPDVWTPWKAQLVETLYEKCRDWFEEGGQSAVMRPGALERRAAEVSAILGENFDAAGRRLLKALEPRHLLAYPPQELASHLLTLRACEEGGASWALRILPHGSHLRLVVSAQDELGLFANIAGVLAACRVNILGADIYTLRSGIALDIIDVEAGQGGCAGEIDDRWQRFERHLGAVLEGRETAEHLVRRARVASGGNRLPPRNFPARVDISNRLSDCHTVIDVYARDRQGLLYDITSVLAELRLSVSTARISTKVDQAADTFYVRGEDRAKLVDTGLLETVRIRLLRAVDR